MFVWNEATLLHLNYESIFLVIIYHYQIRGGFTTIYHTQNEL